MIIYPNMNISNGNLIETLKIQIINAILGKPRKINNSSIIELNNTLYIYNIHMLWNLVYVRYEPTKIFNDSNSNRENAIIKISEPM